MKDIFGIKATIKFYINMASKIEKLISMLEANIYATNTTLTLKIGIFLNSNKREDSG